MAYSVSRKNHTTAIDRLHQSRTRHQEAAVTSSSRGGDDLASASEDRLRRQLNVRDAELGVANRLLAQRALARCPAEALANRIAD